MSQTDTCKQISFSWDIHYKCNYNCPYCWWYGKWAELAKDNLYPSLDTLLKIWTDIYKKYGTAHIEILGGEPLIYPNFNELIKELSKMHTVRITTNLSTSIDALLKNTSPSRVSITGTFHPLFAEFNDFVQKAVLLKKNSRGNSVIYLAYPPQIKLIPYYKERFIEYGLKLSVMSFWGENNGKAYPENYTEEETAYITPHLGKGRGEKYQLRPRLVKGKLCRAGQIYASIKSNGDVARCGGNAPRYLGNIFKGDFKLLGEPTPCESDICPCNEWASFLLVEKKNNNNEN